VAGPAGRLSTVRAGVIGCGLQGQAHLEALAAIDGVELVAIADLDDARLSAAGQRFGVGRRHADALALLDEPLDLVSVCTMPDTHRELVMRALSTGAHVLCEKPLARDAAEAAEMVRAAVRAERLLIAGFNMRFMDAVASVRDFMADGLLGELVCARGFMLADDVPWWGRHYVRAASGGGALASSAVHMVDLLRWLAGSPRPLTATASMARVFPRKRACGAPPGAAERYDVEDLVFGHVRFEGGFWLTLEGTWTNDRAGWNYSFDAYGTRGQAHLQPLELYGERDDGAPARLRADAAAAMDFDAALRAELRAVIAALRTGRVDERLATGEQALVVQAIVDALYRSADAGREVAVEVPAL